MKRKMLNHRWITGVMTMIFGLSTILSCGGGGSGGPSADDEIETTSYVYVANASANTVTAYSIQDDGTLSDLAGTLADSSINSGESKPESMTVNGRFLYVMNHESSSRSGGVQTFAIGSDGKLSYAKKTMDASSIDGGTEPSGIAIASIPK
jgi:6-phosphogluconolactonase (cycloisomerase 2 family)